VLGIGKDEDNEAAIGLESLLVLLIVKHYGSLWSMFLTYQITIKWIQLDGGW
jgi:hypothetical protein